MNYEQCIAAIDARQRFSPKPGLHRVARLLRQLGDPQDRLRCIHVAGTNGKGSVCAMTASILQKAGYRTGLFTSPYLIDFRERFQINGKLIEKDVLCRLTAKVLDAQTALEQEGNEPINSFELITTIGFCWFAEQNCDYVVLEVGLGGRCDATNVISAPAAACITSISLDHTAQLGNSIPEIAAEKAGIIKQNAAVVTPCTQDPAALSVINAVCSSNSADLHITGPVKILESNASGTDMAYDGMQVHIPLLGIHQTENTACAIEIARMLSIEDSVILAGIAACRWPGRLQIVCESPTVLIDAGHNMGGMRVLCETLDTLFSERPLTVILAMMQDKDYANCISQIASRAKRVIGTTIDSPRALSPDAAAKTAAGFCSDTLTANNLPQAVALARAAMEADSVLVICGSVYLAGDALHFFQENIS